MPQGAEKTLIRFVQIALYTAIMFAVSWALWQVMPSAADWAIEQVGLYPMFALAVALPFILWYVAYLLGRNRSGTALDP